MSRSETAQRPLLRRVKKRGRIVEKGDVLSIKSQFRRGDKVAVYKIPGERTCSEKDALDELTESHIVTLLKVNN